MGVVQITPDCSNVEGTSVFVSIPECPRVWGEHLEALLSPLSPSPPSPSTGPPVSATSTTAEEIGPATLFMKVSEALVHAQGPRPAVVILQGGGAGCTALLERRFTISTEELQGMFAFVEPLEVGRFLEERPFLVGLLREARVELAKYFPRSAVRLEVLHDADFGGDAQLVASAVVNLEPLEARRRLRQFDREWWLDNVQRAEGAVCITVDFG